MLLRTFAFLFVLQSSFLFSDLLYKVKELSIEEHESSIDGTYTVRKKFKVGESYKNESSKTAKFFIGDQVGGCISKGGEITLNKAVNKVSSVKLSVGTARFRVKPLKTEAFEVRTPSAVAGVRGTAFSIYLDGEHERITLPEGQLEVIKDDKNVNISAGEKIAVRGGELLDSEKMNAGEMESEMNLILGDVRYKNAKIDKALEIYEKKVKDYKEKIKSGTDKEGEKVKKVIDSEMKKSEKSGEIKMLDELERVKGNLNFRTRNMVVMKSLLSYHQAVDKVFSRYQPYLDKEHAKMKKAFKDEIKKSIKSKDLDTARDLDSWMTDSYKGSKIYPKYHETQSRQLIILKDGFANISGQKASYKLEGNKLYVSIVEGPMKGWTDIWETRDEGKTFRNTVLDSTNKVKKKKIFSFGKAERQLIALYAELHSKYEGLNGSNWSFSEKTVFIDNKELKFALKDNMLTLISEMGPIMMWETRDGGKSFRLVRTKTETTKYENSRRVIQAIE